MNKESHMTQKIIINGLLCTKSQIRNNFYFKRAYRDQYLFDNFKCPFCNCKTLKLTILEEIDQNKNLLGYSTWFVCIDGCGKNIEVSYFGYGISIEDIVKDTIKDYNKWECNK
jgi:hypothetical protein